MDEPSGVDDVPVSPGAQKMALHLAATGRADVAIRFLVHLTDWSDAQAADFLNRLREDPGPATGG